MKRFRAPVWVALLCLACLLVRFSSAEYTHLTRRERSLRASARKNNNRKKRTKAPTPAPTPGATVDVDLGVIVSQSPHRFGSMKAMDGTVYARCDGVEYANKNLQCWGADLTSKVKVYKDWREECALECINHNKMIESQLKAVAADDEATRRLEKQRCLGFGFRTKQFRSKGGRGTCQLKTCHADYPFAGTGVKAFKSQKAVQYFWLTPFFCGYPTPQSDAPTPSPTGWPTAGGTRAPTTPFPTAFPTEYPTPFPTANPTYQFPFRSPTNIPRYFPVHYDRYEAVKPSNKQCQVVQVRINTGYVQFNNFLGNQDDCVRECTYDARCKGVLFSKADRVCVKATTPELTDHTEKWLQRKGRGYTYYIKSGYLLPFRQGKCGSYNKKSCAADKECSLNFGRQGYNVEVRFNGAFCGRKRCNANP